MAARRFEREEEIAARRVAIERRVQAGQPVFRIDGSQSPNVIMDEISALAEHGAGDTRRWRNMMDAVHIDWTQPVEARREEVGRRLAAVGRDATPSRSPEVMGDEFVAGIRAFFVRDRREQ